MVGFSTRIGFVLAAVGAAVGLGNLWRFPYATSQNGGAAFLIVYLALLAVVGIPALMAELSIGRAGQRNFVDALADDGRHPRWAGAGYFGMGGVFILLSYYSAITGWSLRYAIEAWRHVADGAAPSGFDHFVDVIQGPDAIMAHLGVMVLLVATMAGGAAKGIERLNLIAMPALFAAVVALAIYANTSDGSAAGRAFYLKPDLAAIDLGTISGAASQAFFTLSLGVGGMATYASYVGKDVDLQKAGTSIVAADTLVAVLAGLMVFPLMFAFGFGEAVLGVGSNPAAGMYVALPAAFGAMAGGGLVQAVFFTLLFLAAFSSGMSMIAVPSRWILDRWPGLGQLRALLLVALPAYILGIVSAISFSTFLIIDSIISRIVVLVGGLLLAVYAGWVRPELSDELRVASHWRMDRVLRPLWRWGLTPIMAILVVFGFLGFLTDIGAIDPAPGSLLARLT